MSDPKAALPDPVSSDAIKALLTSKGIRASASITPLRVTAAYHSLYLVILSEAAGEGKDVVQVDELILRVSGRHLPNIKTRNEVGVMTWIRRNTKIPIPEIVAWDATSDNPIGHEYTLLRKASGVAMSDVYTELTEEQQLHVLHQLIDYLTELHSFQWDGIGGLVLKDDAVGDAVILSQVVDETFWQTLDVAQFWNPGDSTDSLNIKGPYSTYLDLVCARIQKSVDLIQKHESLVFMRDAVPRIDALLSNLSTRRMQSDDPDALNQVKLRLAHKDLHFANILVDPLTADITAILDWEFAGVVPYIEWNPSRAFLWNGRDDDDDSFDEKQRWMKRFEECCRERGAEYLVEDAKFSSPLQESLHKIHNYLRAIVEVSPRGQRQDLVQGWKNTVLENLAAFGV
ncbi:hypothetical protein NLU13_8045 [Sarocladium strictum]|uniref:Aminoglycoside phosphotransferase domain-containing protein n=1 Tax=Sarocladium strictum TaxID=5046 RepID=A0AA39L496_SARSR|nr:hypothetical protein NLU13_8045 [Sarocladium strictum]